MRKFLIVTVLMSLISFTACTTSELTTALNVVADTASLASITAPILGAAGVIPVPTVDLITNYASQVSSSVVKVETELNSSDTDAIKVSTIIADFASVVVPDIPGVPPTAGALVTGLASAVKTFITQLESTLGQPVTASAEHRALMANGFVPKAKGWKPSMSDKRAISKAVATAKATIARVAAQKHK